MPESKEIYWTVNIPEDYYDKLAPLFETTKNRDDIPRCETIHRMTKNLENDLELDAKICSSDKDDPLWSELVLFENGQELCHSEIGSSLDETLELTYNNITYIVKFAKTVDETFYVNQKPVSVTFTCPSCERETEFKYEEFAAIHGDPPDWTFSVLTCPHCGQQIRVEDQEWN